MKEKFIKSTIILLLGGFLTKVLGMIIKIIMSRLIGTEGLGLYMLILPTFSFHWNKSIRNACCFSETYCGRKT